uniref:BHLH domain-containing protein n=1 Tax=Triticum urartu TaxID=4572 RepID=A0A8R7TT08_TRIUA
MLGLMAAPCQSPQGGNELYDDCDPTVYGGRVLLPRQASSAPPAGPPELSTTSSSTGSGRTATEARALKVHSEAERRRRVRINAHLTALRRMIPDTKQMDKAALLARVVDQVRHLKRRASEAAQQTSRRRPTRSPSNSAAQGTPTTTTAACTLRRLSAAMTARTSSPVSSRRSMA